METTVHDQSSEGKDDDGIALAKDENSFLYSILSFIGNRGLQMLSTSLDELRGNKEGFAQVYY